MIVKITQSMTSSPVSQSRRVTQLFIGSVLCFDCFDSASHYALVSTILNAAQPTVVQSPCLYRVDATLLA